MKQLTTIILAITTVIFSYGQEDYSKSLSGIEWVKITTKANIKIMTHDKNEILIKGSKSKYVSEKAKGLRLVNSDGTDNTNVGFSVLEEGGDLIVTNLKKNGTTQIYLPKNQKIAAKSTWNGNISIEGFVNEVEANCTLNGGITITDVTGPVTANSLNGTVEVIFDKIDQASPTSIFTTNGAVDVSLPGNTPANLSLSSWNGDVYSNFDIQQQSKEGMKKITSKKSTGTINGGGIDITLKSTNGNIYLRKK